MCGRCWLTARPAVWSSGATRKYGETRDVSLSDAERRLAQDSVLSHGSQQGVDLKSAIDNVARYDLAQVLLITAGSETAAARLAGFGIPSTFKNWLKKHGPQG
jgi:hypothetical protein